MCAGQQAATPADVGLQGGNPKIGFDYRPTAYHHANSGCGRLSSASQPEIPCRCNSTREPSTATITFRPASRRSRYLDVGDLREYTCPTSGIYFFSISFSTEKSLATNTMLLGVDLNVILSTDTAISDTATTARSVLLNCQSDSTIYIVSSSKKSGHLAYGGGAGYSLNSFTAFPYAPQST